MLRVDPQATTLLDYHHHPHRKAANGKPGGGDERNGADGGDLVLPVPEGTVVKDARRRGARRPGRPRTRATSSPVAAAGAWATRRWPPRGARRPASRCSASPATPVDVVLELKSLADVALIGFPSAGKSSPRRGAVGGPAQDRRLPVHDAGAQPRGRQAGSSASPSPTCPGLIPGASEGKGLGLEFLRHVERCSVLVHVIDCATLEPGRDPMTDLDVIEAELAAYVPDDALGGRPLSDRTRIVVLNKADVPEARELAEMVRPDLEARGLEVLHRLRRRPHRACASSASRWPATSPQARAAGSTAAEPPRVVLRPKAVDDNGFTVARENTPDGEVFRVVGGRPTRWVRQTDFSNDEAVGYLADRLGRPGSRRSCSRPAPSPATPSHRCRATTPSSSTGSRRCRPAPSCCGRAAATCASRSRGLADPGADGGARTRAERRAALGRRGRADDRRARRAAGAARADGDRGRGDEDAVGGRATLRRARTAAAGAPARGQGRLVAR